MERAQLLKEARYDKGWSQEYVAEQVGVNRITVQRWESGERSPQPYHLRRLCKLFGKTAQELGLADETAPGKNPSVKTTVLPQVSDAYTAFHTNDLTTCLHTLVWSWLLCSNDARYHGLQTAIALELEPKDNNRMNEDTISRRDAIRRLASLSVEYCGLSLFMPVLVRPIDEILIQCAAGVTACWHLRKGKDLAFVSDTLSRYTPTLQEIVTTGSPAQSKEAADLLTQCLILQSELAKHVTNNNAAISYAEQAEQYSKIAENPVLRILVVRRLAAAYSYANRWDLAWHTAEKAKSLLLKQEKVSPVPQIIHSYIYAGLATYSAHNGQTQDALTALGQAHAAFPEQSPNEPVPIWIDNHSKANLMLNDGLTHLYLDMGKEAFDTFGQITESFADSELIRVETTINQVLAEVQREDKPRTMEVCMDLWTAGMQGARALQSEQWFNEARIAYAAMRAAWPTEQRIKSLREQIVHW